LGRVEGAGLGLHSTEHRQEPRRDSFGGTTSISNNRLATDRGSATTT
jgi:hypothetical protein